MISSMHFLYASAKMGFADRSVDGPRENMLDLFETIVERIPHLASKKATLGCLSAILIGMTMSDAWL